MVGLAGCSSSSSSNDSATDEELLGATRGACTANADYESLACLAQCGRLGDAAAAAACGDACEAVRESRVDDCEAVADVAALACASGRACLEGATACRAEAAESFDACDAACGDDPLALRCANACLAARAADEAQCGFIAARAVPATTELPSLPTGEPADLTLLLDENEIATVEAADARAEAIRTREIRLFVGAPGAEVEVTQLEHGFEFGFPVDFREFRDEPEDLEFYRQIALDHASLMVAETALKWRQLEPEPGRLEFDLGDSEMAWADENGFKVKMHTLLWGNAPPVSTGSGTPAWMRERFPNPDLSESEQEELRELIRFQAESIVERYKGRIDIYDITNEMLNPLTAFFSARLGPGIVDDLFRWVRVIDPGAQLVMNEWIDEVFTDLGGPTAADVVARVTELQNEGVPIDAIGTQAHFVPGVLFALDPSLDDPLLENRTRIDDYADTLELLSEPGLPLHMTETTFNTPADGERRAAQAEAIMRLWWGTESVEQIVFWSLWNKVAARNQLLHGIFDDTRDGTLTRHGAAVLSLINDRWRTQETVTLGDSGAAELRVTLGEHLAQWTEDGEAKEARFRVEQGDGTLTVVVVDPPQ